MTAATTRSALPRPRVIAIDDATELLDLLRDLLAASYDLVTLDGTGLDPDELVALEPDLVVVDFNVPGSSAWEVVRSMRSTAPLHDVPVLILSADPGAFDGETVELRTLGGIEVLSKPFAIEELEAAVRRGVFRGTSVAEMTAIEIEAKQTVR